jgi:hypothetical protein
LKVGQAILVIVVLAPLLTACASTGVSATTRRVPPVCQIDTEMSNYTLGRIREVLDPNENDETTVSYRKNNGLSGLRFSNVVVVEDSLTCAKSLIAYVTLREPTDTLAQRYLYEGLPGVFLVRLSSNRYVVTAGIFDPWWMYEHYLLDSKFGLIAKYM